jgi:site-specific recombinase XerD
MQLTESILNYRRFLKRRNFSELTIKNYLHRLKRFVCWTTTPVESTTVKEVKMYIDFMMEQGMAPRTINCHLSSIRGYYDYLKDEGKLYIDNPVVTGLLLREPDPLPRYLPDRDVDSFLDCVESVRDLAIFMLMLRCGLRVQEVVNLTLDVIDYRRSQIFIKAGKGAKDRMVFISHDAGVALANYLRQRLVTKEKRIFLAEKGRCRGKPISVRAIQKRVEMYATISNIPVTCHRLRHTMATQLLNADADLVSIQEILGHSKIKTTQRYSKISNLKVQRDYFHAMEKVMTNTTLNQLE